MFSSRHVIFSFFSLQSEPLSTNGPSTVMAYLKKLDLRMIQFIRLATTEKKIMEVEEAHHRPRRKGQLRAQTSHYKEAGTVIC